MARRSTLLSLPEIGALMLLIALVSFYAGWKAKPVLLPVLPPIVPGSLAMLRELRPFENRYGQDPIHTEHAEEWAIRDFFNDQRGGFFLDVGANDYKHFNNTYYLETALGWSGIAVEPQTAFQADYGQHRRRTRFRPFFVSDVSNAEAKVYVLQNKNPVTSGDKSFVERFGSIGREFKAPTITLNDLLESERVDRLDFMTMDIELWEPKALAGFDLQRYRPALVCIEAHPEVRQHIIDYFSARGYVVVGRYLRIDQYNLYFAPTDHPTRPR